MQMVSPGSRPWTGWQGVLADRVDAYIKTLTVTIATGLVQVEGTAVAQQNVAPIVISGGVS